MVVSRRLPQRIPYLLVADQAFASELTHVSALLPLCAYGRVFVELDSPKDLWPLRVPDWMTINWFFRSASDSSFGRATTSLRAWAASLESRLSREYAEVEGSRPPAYVRPGLLATRAARAWADEVLCEESAAKARVWLGVEGALSERFYAYLTEGLGVLPGNVVRPPEGYRIHAE